MSFKKLDVSDDYLKILREIFKKYIPDRTVWAFGSRVKGLARKTSDLDLCILGETPLSFYQLAELQDALSLSVIPYRVDVVDWMSITPEFRKIIEENYLVI